MATQKKMMTEGEMQEVTKGTQEILAEQPKVKIKLHLPAEKKKSLEAQQEAGKKVDWPFQVVAINGHIYQIQLGVSVEVPESVAQVLEEAGMI